jgi:pSer/pThr/pTyr-binding forkhead associated (FHA) protein
MTGDSSQRRLPVLVNQATNEGYPINSASLTIGRAPDNNIVLSEDGYASGHHARIYWDQGRWMVEDLSSSNGTSVNNQLISSAWQLNPGDLIKVGRTIFRIQ